MKLDILKGLRNGINFFYGIKEFSKYLIAMIGVVTIYMFWVFLAIYYQEMFFDTSVLMIKVLRLAVSMYIIALLFQMLLYFIHSYFFSKDFKKEEEKLKNAIKFTDESDESDRTDDIIITETTE